MILPAGIRMLVFYTAAAGTTLFAANCRNWPTPEVETEVDSTGDFTWPEQARTLAFQPAADPNLDRAVDYALSLYYIKRAEDGPVLLTVHLYNKNLEMHFTETKSGRLLYKLRATAENADDTKAVLRYGIWRFFIAVDLEKRQYKPEHRIQPHRFIGRQVRRSASGR